MAFRSNPDINSNNHSISKLSSLIVISAGAIVLAGYLFNISLLKSIFPDMPKMMPSKPGVECFYQGMAEG